MTEQTTQQASRPWYKIYQELGVQAPDFDDRPVSVYVEDYAKRVPNNDALRYFNTQISYGQLDQFACQLANVFSSQGIAKGDVVGVVAPNTPQYVIAIIALAKMGVTVSGISPLLTPTELCFQIDNAKMKAILILDSLLEAGLEKIDSLPECLKTIVVTNPLDHIQAQEIKLPELPGIQCLDYLTAINSADTQFTQQATHYDDVMYLQYTGGTTGNPKGAMLTLRNVMYTTQACEAYAPFEKESESVACAFPYFHIAGLSFILSSLCAGARALVIADPRDIDHFCEQMIVWPPTRFAAVPTLYQMILNNPLVKKIDFSNLNSALSGAAPLTSELRQAIETTFGKNILSDAFGMTETGPTYVLNPSTKAKPTSVGIPVLNADVAIVDVETGTKELPFGEAGEIIISSPQVMKGYLNLPEETANSLRERAGKTWMYTGDVGSMDEDGYVYLADRAKDMLIVGGYKVFSVEVEDKLAQVDVIEQSAVIGAPDLKRPGNDVVNLYVQLKDPQMNQDDAEQKIMTFCRDNLAPYKVPKQIHFIAQIPLTPVGKLDKKQLRKLLNQS